MIEKFWKDFVQGYTAQVTNYKLLDFENVQVNGIPAIVINLKRTDREGTMHQLCLILDTTNYVFSFTNRIGSGDEKLKKQFFQSIQVNQ